MKKIYLLGSTGSIGTQTLDIVRQYPEDLSVFALAAGTNGVLMEQQAREFKPRYVIMNDPAAASALRVSLKDLDITVLEGMEGMLEVASMTDYDVILTAIVGMIGIRPTIAAMKARHDVALANKETLVTAGHIIMPLVKEYGVSLFPVDSEHSAIFQSLHGEPAERVSKIWLTCSGGPFRGYTPEQLEKVTVEDALKHPNWAMGRKITTDSATLVNKGLEVMEARWLFNVGLEDIKILVHPESIIHSMVEFADGAVIGELGMPDMRLPIQYALFYPDRRPGPTPRADFYQIGKLTFEKADQETFRGLKLALEAARTGGSMPTVFNAANEKAVALFLDKKIRFAQIPRVIESCMEAHRLIADPSVEEILEAEQQVYEHIRGMAL